MATTKYEGAGTFAAWTFLRVATAAIVVFVIVRIVIPDLIDAHSTVDVWLAVAFGVAVPLIVGWAALSVWRSIGRFRRRNRVITRSNGS